MLDLGCAFGFGTRILARRYDSFGVDGSSRFIARAARTVRTARFALAKAEQAPFRDAAFDAVVCLEVLEHLTDEKLAVDEIRRVLKPGGELVVSVPHKGVLRDWDSLNRYLTRTGRQVAFPLDEMPGGSRWHRHYDVADLRALLTGFEIDHVQLTGVGLAEIVNGLLLRLPRRLYEKLQGVYFTLAMAEDDLPLGRQAYNVMIHARKAA